MFAQATAAVGAANVVAPVEVFKLQLPAVASKEKAPHQILLVAAVGSALAARYFGRTCAS